MKALDINVPKGTKIVVVGDIHEHEEQFDLIIKKTKPSENIFFVSVGDIFDKGFGPQVAESILNKIRLMNEKSFGFMVKGNHELKIIRKAKIANTMNDLLSWVDRLPLAISFVFSNQTRLTIVHGGVKPSHKWEDLNVDVETSYLRNIDDAGEMIRLKWVSVDGVKVIKPEKPGGISWHEKYDGRFGYIAAGHEPLKDGKPKFYNYSCNVDTACYQTGIMTAQVFSERGLEDLHLVEGKSKRQPV